MNAAFDDCAVLDALLERQADWPAVFAQFEQSRRPNAAAIAQMALENYTEMRDAVLDARFVRRRDLALGLERRFPDRFIPRYSMVMFHPEIAYAEALRRGAVQAQLLEELDRGTGGEPDGALAEKLITERRSPVSSASASSTECTTITPAANQPRSRVSTRLARSGSARPIDSKVLRPMSTGLPSVQALKRLRSFGKRHGSALPRPMTPFCAIATISETSGCTALIAHY